MAKLKSPVVAGLREETFHNGNPEHYPIPALTKPGSVLMRLTFDDVERQQISNGSDLFVEILTSSGLHPIKFVVEDGCSAEDWQAAGYGTTSKLFPGTRNKTMLAIAKSMRSSPDWKEKLTSFNAEFAAPPLNEAEIEAIIREVERGISE